MRISVIPSIAALLLGISLPSRVALAYDSPCLFDVVRSVSALERRSTPLRIRTTGEYPGGTTRLPIGLWRLDFMKHLQGFARIAGTNTVAMTTNARGGAYLLVGSMGSQPASGLWSKNTSCPPEMPCRTPEHDTIRSVVHLDSANPHPGGIQAVGSLVAIGIDRGHGRASNVRFFDVAHSDSPRELTHLRVNRDQRAETVGITRLRSSAGSDRYVLVAGANRARSLTFYLSSHPDLSHPNARFQEVAQWKRDTRRSKDLPNYQAVQLVNQCDGKLFLVGSYKTDRVLFGRDLIDVHSVELGEGTQARLAHVLRHHLRCESCNFGAAAGLSIDPETSNLLFYATDYWPLHPTRRDTVIRFEQFSSPYNTLTRNEAEPR